MAGGGYPDPPPESDSHRDDDAPTGARGDRLIRLAGVLEREALRDCRRLERAALEAFDQRCHQAGRLGDPQLGAVDAEQLSLVMVEVDHVELDAALARRADFDHPATPLDEAQ